MPKRTLNEQLDDAVEAIVSHSDTPPPRVPEKLEALLRIAADLRDLPSVDFKARLKSDLERRGLEGRALEGRGSTVPAGYHTATACLVARDAARAIEFYKRAFGATEIVRHTDPAGHILQAEIQIGDSRIALAEEAPEWGNLSPLALGGSSVIVSLYVDDVDALAAQAIGAGAKVIFPVADQFYGDRAGRLADPFGHVWIVATHKEDVSADEMKARVQAWVQQDVGPAAPAETVGPAVPAGEPLAGYRLELFLPVRDAAELIDFLKRAFGAEEVSRHTRADGGIAHANLQIGDAVVGTGDVEADDAEPTAIHLYVPDADAAYARALGAGATSIYAPVDQDYGDREAGVKDPFGNHWYLATHKGRPATHVPEGLQAVTSYLHPSGVPRLIDFLKRAFDAVEAFRAEAPDGTVAHAKIRIGESMLEMGEAHGAFQPMPASFHLYVKDTDEVYRRALAAGAVSLSEPADQPWGSRNAGVEDPGGNRWWINAVQRPSPSDRSQGGEARPEPDLARAATASPPEGFHAVTPYLKVEEAPKLIEFLQRAFGATEVMRTGDPAGHFHAEVQIGDSIVMMGNAGRSYPSEAPMPGAIYLYVRDVDATYRRALATGAISITEPADQPYGDRNAGVRDPFGNVWYIATRK